MARFWGSVMQCPEQKLKTGISCTLEYDLRFPTPVIGVCVTFLFHGNKKTPFPHFDLCPPSAAGRAGGDADVLKGTVLSACALWEDRRHPPMC